MNFFKRIIGAVIAPKRTFAYLADNPDWQVPLFFPVVVPVLIFEVFEDVSPDMSIVTGIIVLLILWAIIWSILSAELYLLGKIVKVQFRWPQSYTITGYALFISLIAAAILPPIIRFFFVRLNASSVISFIDSANIIVIVFLLYNIFLLCLAVHHISQKAIKTVMIAAIHGLIIIGISHSFFKNGTVAEHYKNGKLDGAYVKYYKNGKLENEANYKNGKEEGIAKWYAEEGQLISELTYKDGQLEGMCTYYNYYDSLKGLFNASIEPYKGGKKEGVEKTYSDGKLAFEVPYINDKKNGMEKGYYPSGKLSSEAFYTDGIIQGIDREYYEDGRLKSEFTPKDANGREIKKEYYESGRLKEETPYKNRVDRGNKEFYEYEYPSEDGLQKEYYENGMLKQEINWTHGRKKGISKKYYESGKLKGIATYKNDRLNGHYKMYAEDGTLKETGSYVYGMREEKGIPKWRIWSLKILSTLLRQHDIF